MKYQQMAIDSDVQAVVEFMQEHIPATRLVGVAEALPKMARLLWEKYPQEPVDGVILAAGPMNGLQPGASVPGPVPECAGGGFAAVA